MGVNELLSKFPSEKGLKNRPRPYINHSVEFKKSCSAEDRVKAIEKAGLNVFFFPSEMITGCDMLSDSGTTTMTSDQWAAMHTGDEAYGANRGFFLLRNQIRRTFGEEFFSLDESNPNAFLFHQGRPCEDALFSLLSKKGNSLIIPSNGHFDTTHANIEAHRMNAINLFSDDLKDKSSDYRFKGNMNLEKLKDVIEQSKEKIPLAYLTITNNTGGGQPVCMQNIKEVSKLVHDNNIPLFFDACRFAENAWFIKNFEPGYEEKSIKEIIKEMFTYVDGFTISFKKDGLVNMGGGLFIKEDSLFKKLYPDIPEKLMNLQIIKEGNPSYGGMSGRDIMALVEGLKIVTRQDYLTHRIKQVHEFGKKMKEAGIPVVSPFGGHAIYLDVNEFFKNTDMKPEDFGGISLTALLLAGYGHRACELGYFAFGKYDPETGKEEHPEINFVRFAIPRLRYEKQDLNSVVDAVKTLYENRNEIPPVKVKFGRELALRHFKARFEFA